MSFEKRLLESVTAARAAALAAKEIAAQGEAESGFASALGALLASVERHPELTADESVHLLSEQLGAAESKIAKSREFYNDTVTAYNTLVGTLPMLLIAKTFGFASCPRFISQA